MQAFVNFRFGRIDIRLDALLLIQAINVLRQVVDCAVLVGIVRDVHLRIGVIA